jgi:hypothetical protein
VTKLVSPAHIEQIVGVARDQRLHIGRLITAEPAAYILHSQECVESGIDLRDCEYSLALDRGIGDFLWDGFADVPVELAILSSGDLAPLCVLR